MRLSYSPLHEPQLLTATAPAKRTNEKKAVTAKSGRDVGRDEGHSEGVAEPAAYCSRTSVKTKQCYPSLRFNILDWFDSKP